MEPFTPETLIAGIDYSTSSPAICIHKGDAWNVKNCTFYFFEVRTKKTKKSQPPENLPDFMISTSSVGFNKLLKVEKYRILGQWAQDACRDCGFVGLEDYAMNGNHLAIIGECTGILKLHLAAIGLEPSLYAPGHLKLFATGKGNAGKPQMYEAFFDETQLDLHTTLELAEGESRQLDDIVDAYFICKRLFKAADFEGTKHETERTKLKPRAILTETK